MDNLSFFKFKELQSKGYTLDLLYILDLYKNNIDLNVLDISEKIKSLIQSLERKGLITKEGNITLIGQNLLEFISNPGKELKLIKKKPDDAFLKFWEAFPPTDTFEHRGIPFMGSRSLRINKEDCKVKLQAILNEGEHTIEEIVGAIKYDVYLKKEMSVKTRTNKLSYLQNSLTYLRSKSFEAFIEEGRKLDSIVETINNVYDGVNL